MKIKLFPVAALVILTSIACTLGGIVRERGEETVPPSPGEEATYESPAAEPEGEAEEPAAPEVNPAALDELQSYRIRWIIAWTPESGVAEQTVIEQALTRTPPARQTRIETTGEGETIEWVEIGDTAWLCSGGSCVLSSRGEAEMSGFEDWLSFEPSGFTAGSEFREIGQETVNGVVARHYILSMSAAQLAALASGEISDVQGDVWIAEDPFLPTFVIRLTSSWTEIREGQPGESTFSYEVYDINAPFTIEPPEGVPSGLPAGLPEYPNATNLVVMEGLASFSAPDDVATVAEFYRDQLITQGWSLESESDMAGGVVQIWNKESQTLNLMISPQEQGSSVIITLE